MKIAMKEVVVKQEVYIANDGKEFDDYDDCVEHEIKLAEASMEFYDSDFEKSDLESCTYIKVNTPEEIEVLRDLCRYYGISHKGISDKTGIYMYFDRVDTWKNISEAVDRIRSGG